MPCALCFVLCALVASAEVQVIGGKKYECRDGVCYLVDDANLPAPVREGADGTEEGGDGTVWGEAGEPVIATGPTVTLTDGDPPADKAFYTIYTIGVSVP